MNNKKKKKTVKKSGSKKAPLLKRFVDMTDEELTAKRRPVQVAPPSHFIITNEDLVSFKTACLTVSGILTENGQKTTAQILMMNLEELESKVTPYSQ